MPKRWLVQKKLKQKKFRERARGVMKRYSQESINVAPTPNKQIMQWYRNSARSLAVPMLEIYRYNREPISDARLEALELARDIRDACQEWRYFRLVEDSWLRARMYFSNDHSTERCCIIEYDPRRGQSRRSIVYRNRDVAYTRWCDNSIDWVDFVDFYHPNIPETFP